MKKRIRIRIMWQAGSGYASPWCNTVCPTPSSSDYFALLSYSSRAENALSCACPVISPSLYLVCVLALPVILWQVNTLLQPLYSRMCLWILCAAPILPAVSHFATTPVLDLLCFSLLCAVFTLSVPVFRIRIQFRIQSGQWTRIRSRRAKMATKIEEN